MSIAATLICCNVHCQAPAKSNYLDHCSSLLFVCISMELDVFELEVARLCVLLSLLEEFSVQQFNWHHA